MTHHTPLVTVVMPAYNAERWIAGAIASVMGQTLSNWELIVVNDGSTDGTEAVVGRCCDRRLQLVNQEHKGAAAARNRGIARARAKYVALLDADDWYEPRHLERTTDFLEREAACALVGTNFFFVDSNGHRTLGCKPNEILGRPGDGVIPDYFRAAMRNRCFPITDCAVFRRDKVAELGGFDTSLASDEDHEFWTRWAMASRFGYIDEPLCCYRVDTPGSARKHLGRSIRMRVRLWKKLTSLERRDSPFWKSYARCRSFYLFRLTAIAIAAGYLDEVDKVAEFWPPSPTHAHWWMGKLLTSLPRFCRKAIHAVLGRCDFVKYRQGRPVSVSADGS